MAGISQAGLLEKMITQEFSAAINNGNATGASNLTHAIDRTKAYWVGFWGSRFGSAASTANPGVIDSMSSDSQVSVSRSSGSTANDATVYGYVTGVRAD